MRRNTEGDFWAKVDRSGECWLWTGHTLDHRYGSFAYQGKYRLAHRLSWLFTRGPIVPGLEVCHTCDNGFCVRPAHLFLGTHRENMEDAKSKGRIMRGSRQNLSKLTEANIVAIREAWHGGASFVELAAVYGVDQSNISRAARGIQWAHVK